MSAGPQNLQATFLAHLNERKVPVTIYLMNGIRLQGFIDWFDRFSVVLHRDGHSQLVYKSNISTILPMTAVKLFEGESSPRQM